MKKNLILLFAIFPMLSYSQYLKFSIGPSFSSMNINSYKALEKNRTGVNFQVGLDYFEHKYYYISSEIGYVETGGSDMILSYGDVEKSENVSLRLSNIHVNSTFRCKLDIKNNLNFFAGFGPKIDYQFSPNYKPYIESSSFYEFPNQKFLFGIKMEVGIQYELKNIKLGMEYSNNQSFNKSNNFLKNNYNLINFTFAIKVH